MQLVGLKPFYDLIEANGEDVASARALGYFDMTSNLGRHFRFHTDARNGNVGFLWRGTDGSWIETLKICAIAPHVTDNAEFYTVQYLNLKWDEDRFTKPGLEYSWNVTPWWHPALVRYKGERPRAYEMVRVLEYIKDGRITVPEGVNMWVEPEPEPEVVWTTPPADVQVELPVPERVFEATPTHLAINLRELKRRVRARIRW